MPIKVINDSDLTGIANAIRAQNESQNTYTPEQMAAEIASWILEPTYTVYFYSDSTLLQTAQNVSYGGDATYTGQTPTKTGVADPENYIFTGWSPSPNGITQDMSCYAQFSYEGVVVEEIQDDWSTIISKIENGTAAYKVGMYKPLDLGTEGIVNMQIVAKGEKASELSSGSGYATYDWLSKELLKTTHVINPSSNLTHQWKDSSMRTYMRDTIKQLIPQIVRDAIKEVKKYSYIYSPLSKNNVSTENVWLPSYREVFGGSSLESNGPSYTDIYNNNSSRIKKKTGTNTAMKWLLRTADNSSTAYFRAVDYYGQGTSYREYNDEYIALGFST